MTPEEIEAELAAEEEFAKKLGPYVGQWIGVRDHEVVAHSWSFDELAAAVHLETVVVWRVPRGPVFV